MEQRSPDARSVARCILWLAERQNPPVPISNKKLQKLLYYAQGWSLAKRGTPAFHDRIKAWKEGPVVPDVWHWYRNESGGDLQAARAAMEPDAMRLIAAVWSDYGRFTPDELSDMTHREPPWVDAYKPDSNGHCKAPIPNEAIAAYFGAQAAPRLSNEELLALGRMHRPPESWYGEPPPFRTG